VIAFIKTRQLAVWATALIVLGAASPSGHAQEFQQASENAKEEFKKADAELNAVYHQCLASGKLGPLAINALQSAQRLWVEYRDLNSTAYTAKGSGRVDDDDDVLYARTVLTRDRIRELKELFLTPVDHPKLIMKITYPGDSPVPSPNAFSFIPEANPDLFKKAATWKMWRNPGILVEDRGIFISGSRNPVSEEKLLGTLAALSPKAWPYGRIAAVCVSGPSADYEKLEDRREGVISKLQSDDIVVNLFPDN